MKLLQYIEILTCFFKIIKSLYSDGFPILIKATRMGLSIVYFKDHRSAFLFYDVFLSLRIVLP